MKKFLLALSTLCMLAFTGCDYVKFPVQTTTNPINSSGDTAVQRVLLEYFTGQGCGNCPGSPLIAEQLQDLYGDRLIMITNHAGHFANNSIGNPWHPSDLNNQNAEDLDAAFGMANAGNPNGLVNRKESNGNFILTNTAWGTAMQDILTNELPKVEINIDASYVSADDHIVANITVDVLEELTGNYNIVAVVTENSIVAPQKNYIPNGNPAYPSPIAEEYIHKHVHRGHFNSTWGSPLFTGTTSTGISENVSYTKAKGSSWDSGNLTVVVYVYDVATNEIIQVREEHVD